MKIAIVPGIFFPKPGGAQIQTHNLANKLVEKGQYVDVLLNKNTNIRNNNYNIKILNNFILSLIYFFKVYFKINLKYVLKLYLNLIIKINKYDFWHFIFLNFKNLILINCLKELDQTIIVTFQGADIQIDKNINYGYRLNKNYNDLLKKTIKNIDLFISISKNIKKDIIDLNVPKDKIILIPNSVEIQKIQKIKKNFTKKKTNFLRLITVARFAEKKKGFDLVETFARKLISQKIKFTWTFVGKNIYKIKKNDYIKNNHQYFNYIDNIENIDETYYPHTDLIKIYLDSDLYVNLARIESFGITFIESLACDLPIISFKKKGVDEVVVHKKNGYLSTSSTVDYLIAKIKELQSNKLLLNELKKNCAKSIFKFDTNLTVDLTIKSYENLINKMPKHKN
jgi:glycosyltransferase involved in cell wall biosynthesis